MEIFWNVPRGTIFKNTTQLESKYNYDINLRYIKAEKLAYNINKIRRLITMADKEIRVIGENEGIIDFEVVEKDNVNRVEVANIEAEIARIEAEIVEKNEKLAKLKEQVEFAKKVIAIRDAQIEAEKVAVEEPNAVAEEPAI